MSSPDEKRLPVDEQRSVSDGDLDTEKKRRRVRRRRGNRGRFRPYDLPDGDAQPGSSTTDKKIRRSGKPMAPNNTTQFLLEDMEARAEAEREVEAAQYAEDRQRVRSISVSSELLLGGSSDDGSDSISDAEHREFETELEEFNMDRLSTLSKKEMTREILDKDKTAEVYHENLVRMNRENERLRRLLKDNGIPVETEKSPGRPQPVA